MGLRRIPAALVVTLGGLAVAPAAAPAAPPSGLTATLRDTTLIGGDQHAEMRGRVLPRVRRPVRLERRTGRTWTTIARSSSNGTGRYEVTDLVSRAGDYRIVAPPIRLGGVALQRLVSAPRQASIASTLLPGQTMRGGQFLKSENGDFRLQMKTDGNLAVFQKGAGKIWWTATYGADRRVVMQSDGNLVVYGGDAAVWSTTTNGFPSSFLKLEDNGMVCVYKGQRLLWNGRKGVFYDKLRIGQTLRHGAQLRSQNHQYRAVMQADGNFVIYDASGAATWATASEGADEVLVMERKSDLVIYRGGTTPVWHTSTHGFRAAHLRLRNGGSLVVHRRRQTLWSSNQGFLLNQLLPGVTLEAGGQLLSESHAYRLAMQSDGDLVMFNGDQALWSSGTAGYPGAKAVMEGDGNLVVYDAGGTARWFSDTAGHPGSRLIVHDDGNLVIYQGAMALWDRLHGALEPSDTADVSDALVRGQTWVDAGVPHSQPAYVLNQYGTYRTDSSGFVSMMWNLGYSYVTWTLPDISHQITKEQLQPGDILLSPLNHVLVFVNWTDSSHSSYWAYEETPDGAVYRSVPYPYWSGYGTFTPYRKN
jgi:hypothetical protein